MRRADGAGAVAFGTTAEAEAAAGRVNRMHRKVSGTLPRRHGSRKAKAGTAYTAMDPDLLLWVHATFVDTLLVAHDRLVRGLTEPARDGFVAEWAPETRRLAVPARFRCPDHVAMPAY